MVLDKNCAGELSIVYSQTCQMALAGGNFDGRHYFKKSKATGIDEVDERERNNYRAKVKIMDLLDQRPELLTPALAYIEDRMLGISANKNAPNPREASHWPSTYMYMEKIPKYWRGEWLLRTFSKHGLNNTWLADLDQRFPSAIVELFDFVNGIGPKTKIPRHLLDKSIMSTFFDERVLALRRGTATWLRGITNAFENPATLNWGDYGCYKFQKAAGGGGGGLVLHHCDGPTVALGASVGAMLCMGARHVAMRIGVCSRGRY